MIGLILCLLLVTVSHGFTLVRATGVGTVYISVDGSIDPPNSPIQRNDNVYTLTGDIISDFDGIVIEMNNITLDGSGHTIRGPYPNAPVKWEAPEYTGMILQSVNDITVKNVTIKDYDDGCHVVRCSDTIVTKCTFTNNWQALVVNDCVNTVVVENNITANLHTGGGSAEITHNNFINNTIDDGASGSYPMGGNFWSEYTGIDANGDGIGDTPFCIYSRVIDHYPLINPYSEWIKTALSISTSTPTTSLGFAVKINGTLTDTYGNTLEGKTIILSYIFTGASEWAVITSSVTDSNGDYSVQWIPQATGYFTIKAEWLGNVTDFWTSSNVTLATLPYENSYVFSVESNSTITALTFNSTSLELSFNASGPSGTKGNTKITLAKSLVGNVADVRVYVDQNQINYTSRSLDDSWELVFTYAHSMHKVTIGLGATSISFAETPFGRTLTYGTIISVIVIAAIALLVLLRKRNRSRSRS